MFCWLLICFEIGCFTVCKHEYNFMDLLYTKSQNYTKSQSFYFLIGQFRITCSSTKRRVQCELQIQITMSLGISGTSNRPYVECLKNDFHCACLRTEIFLREQTISSMLNPNPNPNPNPSSHSVDPQFSHKLPFFLH